jgi:hypothetical protein
MVGGQVEAAEITVLTRTQKPDSARILVDGHQASFRAFEGGETANAQ